MWTSGEFAAMIAPTDADTMVSVILLFWYY